MDHGARRAIILPLLIPGRFLPFFFHPLRALPLAQPAEARKILRGKKNTAAPSVPIPASTHRAQCTRRKHPLNIGVYGPRRGKSARVKPPVVIWPFIRIRRALCLSLFLFFLPPPLALSLHRFFSLPPRSAANSYTHSSKATCRFSRFFSARATVSLIPFSSSSRRFFGFLARARECARLSRVLPTHGWEAHGDKRHRRQKCCPPPVETAQQF